MPKLTLLVGPPGSGKSTMAKDLMHDDGWIGPHVYVNQDSQKGEHMDIFFDAVQAGKDIIIDRMNFNKQQRAKYIDYAKLKNPAYEIEITVLHQPYAVCLERIRNRFGKHETINDEKSARGALQTFFTKYERPTEDEGKLTFIYPDGPKPHVVVCDLDGTLCEVEHRRHHVRPNNPTPEGFKKNWKAFFEDMEHDTVIEPVSIVLKAMAKEAGIVYCSGRPDDYKRKTLEWLKKNNLYEFKAMPHMGTFEAQLHMRPRSDSRQDDIIKEIILDFEILTRFKPLFMLDDRDQVVAMWRRRGFICMQIAPGDF